MAEIIPFRGLRYNAERVGRVTDVVSPPYDRVYPHVQEMLYEKSPYNIVRIIKGKEQPGDGADQNVYTRAAQTFATWRRDGTLLRDEEPSVYGYHQEYAFGGERMTRKGVIALGRLEPEKVHAHERTLRGPKEDRLRLMRATEANFGHIFMLYSDAERTADRVLAAAIVGRAPLIEAEDADGNAHRVWSVTDPATVQAVQRALADKDLYIADGHHRYETAVNYLRECRQKGWTPAAPESFDVRMMTLFNVAEPGMSIRPIHRMVHGIDGFDPARFLADAAEHFVIDRCNGFDKMRAATEQGRGRHTFGVAWMDGFATLRLRDEAVMEVLLPGEWSSDYRRLDVSVLHAAILDRLLGIDAQALEEQRNITYTVDPAEGVESVLQGREQLFFHVNATSADEVIRVADHGEKMPQKSTDFYPKLLTGLVMTAMEIRR